MTRDTANPNDCGALMQGCSGLLVRRPRGGSAYVPLMPDEFCGRRLRPVTA